MSAAFALSPSGPPAPCSFPKCVLEAFHDGDHDLAPGRTNDDKRIAFPGPRYGRCVICSVKFVEYGDPAHPPSRICDKHECGLELARREAAPLPLMCACPQRPYAHELIVHTNLRREGYNPAVRRRWPWSLSLSDRLEPSAEDRQSV
jgi:hypothetical protein